MSKGTLVEHRDGRRGIIYEEDQNADFPGKKSGKYLVTMTDEDWNHLDTPKRLIHEDKLKVKGLQD